MHAGAYWFIQGNERVRVRADESVTLLEVVDKQYINIITTLYFQASPKVEDPQAVIRVLDAIVEGLGHIREKLLFGTGTPNVSYTKDPNSLAEGSSGDASSDSSQG